MKKLWLFLIFGILLMSSISALEFDNVKSYSNDNRVVTITNAFGLGDDIAKIELTTPFVNEVARGENQRVMIFEVENFGGTYTNALKETEIINMKNSKSENKDFHYEYAIYEDVEVFDYEESCEYEYLSINKTYKRVCKMIKGDSHFENKIVGWKKLNSKDIPKGKLTIALVTDVEAGDYYDGIPTIFGEKLTRWAIWTESLNVGLVAYWNFENETANSLNLVDNVRGIHNGTNNDTSNWTTGIIDNGLSYSPNNRTDILDSADWDVDEYTISIWVNPNSIGTGTIYDRYNGAAAGDRAGLISLMANNSIRYITEIDGNGTRMYSEDLIAINTWTHLVVNYNTTDMNMWVNGTKVPQYTNQTGTIISAKPIRLGLDLDNMGALNGTLDEFSFYNRTLSQTEITQIYNTHIGMSYNVNPSGIEVTLDSPSNNNLYLKNSIVEFNATIVPSNGNLTNATLFIWDSSSNEINITTNIVKGNESNQTSFEVLLTDVDTLDWNVYGCMENATSTACGFAGSNRSVITNFFLENNRTFNAQTTEGASETFILNLTKEATTQFSSIDLVYNSTSYASTFSIIDSEIIVTNSIVIPSVDISTTLPFYWSIVLSSGTIVNTTSSNQTASSIQMGDCETYDTLIYNYTIYDEENQSALSNATIEIQFEMYDSAKTIQLLNFSKAYTNTNNASICMNGSLLTTVNYSIDSVAKYSCNETYAENLSNFYAIEYYNILGDTITNTTVPKNIKLYNLKSEDATEFQLTFKDSSLVLASNILVYIYRQYVADGTFRVVEIPLTDSNGQTILHLVRNDIVYNFVMVDEHGTILATFNKMIAFCKDYTIGECTINLNAPSEADDLYNYTDDLKISYTQPTYSNITDLVSFDFISSDLSPVIVSTEIIKNSDFGNRTVCTNSLTSSTGTLTCNVSSVVDTDRFLFINIFVEGDLKTTTTIDLERDSFNFGIVNGAFFAFILILLLITMFMEDRQTLLIALGVGWAAVISLALISGALFGALSGGVWLIICIIIFYWKLKQEEKF